MYPILTQKWRTIPSASELVLFVNIAQCQQKQQCSSLHCTQHHRSAWNYSIHHFESKSCTAQLRYTNYAQFHEWLVLCILYEDIAICSCSIHRILRTCIAIFYCIVHQFLCTCRSILKRLQCTATRFLSPTTLTISLGVKGDDQEACEHLEFSTYILVYKSSRWPM